MVFQAFDGTEMPQNGLRFSWTIALVIAVIAYVLTGSLWIAPLFVIVFWMITRGQ
ncbi:MAG: hypothetical protein JW834_01605 [Candidatus Diapherotrites archaeon]|nr:hypothetical protein [Candidatus Diapherotrites archaeon]